MAYPENWDKSEDPFLDAVEKYEQIPLGNALTGETLPRNTDRGIVHFDLDTQNGTWSRSSL